MGSSHKIGMDCDNEAPDYYGPFSDNDLSSNPDHPKGAWNCNKRFNVRIVNNNDAGCELILLDAKTCWNTVGSNTTFEVPQSTLLLSLISMPRARSATRK